MSRVVLLVSNNQTVRHVNPCFQRVLFKPDGLYNDFGRFCFGVDLDKPFTEEQFANLIDALALRYGLSGKFEVIASLETGEDDDFEVYSFSTWEAGNPVDQHSVYGCAK